MKEIPAGFVVQVKCNNCTCINGVISCTEKQCDKPCEWSNWAPSGPCSVTCGKGKRTYKRVVDKPAEYDGEKCTGKDTLVKECNAGPCPCEENEEYDDSNKCEATCKDHNNPTGQVATNCQPTCKCKDGFFREGEKCVNGTTCEVCKVNGTVIQPGHTWTKPDGMCQVCNCKLGKESCNEVCNNNTLSCATGERKVLVPGTSCCFRCENEPPKKCVACKLTQQTLSVADLAPALFGCPEAQKARVTVSRCAGSCPAGREVADVWIDGVMNAPSKTCSCCSGDKSTKTSETVTCNGTKHKIQIQQYSGCSCKPCGGK